MNLEQWINKFVKICKITSETLALVEITYGAHAMKKSSVFEQHKWFKEMQDIHDDTRSGQSKTQQTNTNVDIL